MTDQKTTTETPSRDGIRQQRQKQKALRRRRMIGVPALVLAAAVFGYGVWMMLEDEPAQVEGINQENTTTTAPDAFPEDEPLPGVDVGDPAFDESGGVETDTGLIDATSIVREDP